MLAVALVLLAAVAMATYLASYVPTQMARQEALRSDALATNFLMYRNAVVRYVEAHPGASGNITDTVLTWEPGYQKAPGWAATVVNGHVYAYSLSAVPPGAVQAAYRLSGGSMLIGTKGSAGTLRNPALGETGITLPAVIQNGCLAAVNGGR